jgi:hypothetical protein
MVRRRWLRLAFYCFFNLLELACRNNRHAEVIHFVTIFKQKSAQPVCALAD